MRDILLVIDMQTDFVDGALGSAEAVAIIPNVLREIAKFDKSNIIATRDTHPESYMQTREGKHLPVPHCIKDTDGWQIHPELEALRKEEPIDKPSFGSVALAQLLKTYDTYEEKIEEITLIGLCTDICVISNAMIIKAYLPETPIFVDAKCCAGVTPESHERALDAMAVCQITALNR